MNVRAFLVAATILAPLPAWAIGTYDPSYPPVTATATAAPQQQQRQGQGQGQQQSIGNSGNNHSSASVNEQSAPLLAPAPFSASGANAFSCPVVGLGVGGAGPASGGILSIGTTSSDCTAMLLAQWAGQPLSPAQVALLSEHFPEFKRAWEATHPAQQQSPTSVVPVSAAPLPPAADALHGTSGADGYCTVLSAGERARHPECP